MGTRRRDQAKLTSPVRFFGEPEERKTTPIMAVMFIHQSLKSSGVKLPRLDS